MQVLRPVAAAGLHEAYFLAYVTLRCTCPFSKEIPGTRKYSTQISGDEVQETRKPSYSARNGWILNCNLARDVIHVTIFPFLSLVKGAVFLLLFAKFLADFVFLYVFDDIYSS